MPTGSEPATGENPSQTLKTGAKSNTIIVSPRQVRQEMGCWGFWWETLFEGWVGSGGRRAEVHVLCLFIPSSCVYHFSLIPAFIQIYILHSFLVIHLFLPIDTPPFMHSTVPQHPLLGLSLWLDSSAPVPGLSISSEPIVRMSSH